MSASTSATVVSLAALIVIATVIIIALYTKGNVKASGKVGANSFSIEASEKQK